MNNFKGKTVLVTGGTRGIGLATGLAFGRLGAQVVLTSRYGPEDPSALLAAFSDVGALPPLTPEADVAQADDTAELMMLLRDSCDKVDILISNAAFAPSVSGIDDYVKRDFMRSIEYCAWPVVDYCKGIHATFGSYPQYVVGLSSFGHLRYIHDYDAIAVAKSVLETLIRYLGHRLGPQGVSVNAVRAGFVETEALHGVLGPKIAEELKARAPQMISQPEVVANAVLGLCSGYFDGVNGQIIHVDKGTTFSDNLVSHIAQEQS